MNVTERICCVCRVKQPTDKMLRVARLKNAASSYTFVVDKKHQLDGRGVHVCPNCVEKAIKTKALNRSFKCPVPENIYDELRRNELLPFAGGES
jgi:predicted RNA-binding protein YlxR (DUF448 family)